MLTVATGPSLESCCKLDAEKPFQFPSQCNHFRAPKVPIWRQRRSCAAKCWREDCSRSAVQQTGPSGSWLPREPPGCQGGVAAIPRWAASQQRGHTCCSPTSSTPHLSLLHYTRLFIAQLTCLAQSITLLSSRLPSLRAGHGIRSDLATGHVRRAQLPMFMRRPPGSSTFCSLCAQGGKLGAALTGKEGH